LTLAKKAGDTASSTFFLTHSEAAVPNAFHIGAANMAIATYSIETPSAFQLNGRCIRCAFPETDKVFHWFTGESICFPDEDRLKRANGRERAERGVRAATQVRPDAIC